MPHTSHQQAFITDQDFNQSHRMGHVTVTLAKMVTKFGNATDENIDGKVSHEWTGEYTAKDGSKHRASVWDWKGSLLWSNQASVWIENEDYLPEFKGFLQA